MITFTLTQDLLEALSRHLGTAGFNLDRLVEDLYRIVDRKLYRDNLLFRDYRQINAKPRQDCREKQVNDDVCDPPERIPDAPKKHNVEAEFYVGNVLFGKRLALAPACGADPTNMHRLLERLIQLNEDRRWETAAIRRARDRTPNLDGFFKDFSLEFTRQCERLRDNFSACSRLQLEASGPYWLTVHDNAVVMVAEELGLADVLHAVPKPVQARMQGDPDARKWLGRVIESLNKRYALLRACGLPPQEWWDREPPSTNQLKGCKRLREQAERLMAEPWAIASDVVYHAYKRSFEELGPLDGYRTFEEWADSAVGVEMLGRLESLYRQEPDEDREQVREISDVSYDPEGWAEVNEGIARLPRNFPDEFTPVMTRFFLATIAGDLPLFGPCGLLLDPGFLPLVDADPALRDLRGKDLAKALGASAEELILRHVTPEEAKGRIIAMFPHTEERHDDD